MPSKHRHKPRRDHGVDCITSWSVAHRANHASHPVCGQARRLGAHRLRQQPLAPAFHLYICVGARLHWCAGHQGREEGCVPHYQPLHHRSPRSGAGQQVRPKNCPHRRRPPRRLDDRAQPGCLDSPDLCRQAHG